MEFQPIQRLIVGLKNQQHQKQQKAPQQTVYSLLRNCCIPKTDIQIENDRTFGYIPTSKYYAPSKKAFSPSTKISSNKKKNRFGKNRRRPFASTNFQQQNYTGEGEEDDDEEEIKTTTPNFRGEFATNMSSSWDRPIFRDFQASIWCERLLLGEPPVRSAVLIPSSESVTFESLKRVFQQFRNLQPEDILLICQQEEEEEDEDYNDENETQKQQKQQQNDYFLGPVLDADFTNNNNNNVALQKAVEAIEWRFLEEFQKNDENKKKNEDEEDNHPLDFVSMLKIPSSSSSSSLTNNDNNTEDIDYDFLAFLSALWTTHPEEAHRALKLQQQQQTTLSVNNNNNNQRRGNFLGSIMDEDSKKRLFQFSMLSCRDENILAAGKRPEMLKGILPGVVPARLTSMVQQVSEKVEEKEMMEKIVREEGQEVLQRVSRF